MSLLHSNKNFSKRYKIFIILNKNLFNRKKKLKVFKMMRDISLSFNKKEAEILLNSLNLSKELNLLPDDSHLLTALISKTYDVAKNLIDENIYTKEKINRLEQKIKESVNKYRIFVENFPGIAFQGYQDFSAGFFEGKVKEMTGYTEEDFTSG